MAREDFLSFFKSGNVSMVTTISAIIGLFGCILNLIILAIFFRVFGAKRFQSSLWINLCFALLLQSLIIVYDAMGNFIRVLSDSEFKCRFRYALPIAMNLVVLGSYLMLLMERMMVLHFPIFYSMTPKIDTLMLLYGWCYGLAFLAMVLLKWQPYASPSKCVTPYVDQTPAEGVTFFTYLFVLITLVISFISLLFLFPGHLHRIDRLRLSMEMKGTNLTIYLGTVILILWFPRQIVSVLYWLEEIDIITFQVTAKLTMMFSQLDILVPFWTLITRSEFRSSFAYMLTFTSMEPIRRKLRSQESYIETINKLVATERGKAGLSRKDSRKMSMPVMKVNAPSTHGAAETPGPLPRNEYLFTMDESSVHQSTEI